MVFLVSPRRKRFARKHFACVFLWPLGILCSGLAAGCKEESNRDDTASPAVTTGVGVYTADTSILAQAIGDLVDELASALAENGAGGSLIYTAAVPLSLAEENAFVRKCTVDDPFDPIKVTVEVDTKRVFSGKINGGAGKSAFTWTTKFEGTGSSKRVWTRPEPGVIGCDDPATRLLLDWGFAENVEGLGLAVEDERTSTRAATSLDGTPIYARKTTVKGKRNTTWKATGDAEEGAEIKRTKVVTVDLNRTINLTNMWGDKVTLDTTLKTKEDAPLEASMTRTFSEKETGLTGTLQKVTATKGTLVARGEATKTTLEVTFEGVVFEPGKENACLPTAGKVTGRIVGDDDPSSKVTFEVNFADKALSGEKYVSLSVGNGAKKTCEACILDACDLAL
ncbi:MAG: hypothetical protein IOD12_14675 [Silvanigrellales bacterium]|nr:hypothetical protein [Silvanigrellales bacterium]